MITKIDKLGRVVIPKAIREMMGVKLNEKIELRLEGKKLIITKGE